MIRIAVGTEPLDTGAALAAVEATGAGGIASFTGLVRADDGVAELMLEHYPAMTERALHAIAEAACARWGLAGVTILHRVGPMVPGDRIVFVATAAAHRAEALAACAYCIDRLKTDAPFWKRERTAAGERWVEARSGDEARAEAWG